MANSTDGEDDFDRRQNIVDLFVGAKIRFRRVILGLTEDELASATGLSRQRIQAIEAGDERVGAPRLMQFSQVLDAPISWFFIGIDTDAQPEFGGRLPDRTAEHVANESLELLSYSFKSLTNSDHRTLVLRVVDWLANLEMRKATNNSQRH